MPGEHQNTQVLHFWAKHTTFRHIMQDVLDMGLDGTTEEVKSAKQSRGGAAYLFREVFPASAAQLDQCWGLPGPSSTTSNLRVNSALLHDCV